MARRMVIIAAPYAEELDEADAHPSGHRSTFDERFFSQHPPDRLVVFRSPQWSTGDCFVAVYGPSRITAP